MSRQLEQFVACVFEPDDWVEIRCLRDGDAQKSWSPARALPQHHKRLAALNGQGWNVHAGPNPRTARGRSGDSAVPLCRCLFADFDGLPSVSGYTLAQLALCMIEETGLPTPTLTIDSGHGVHVYWRLAEPVKTGRWRELQQRLNATLGSDTSIKNPERLMRLPGFQNVKAEPVPCVVVDADPRRVYRLSDIEPLLQTPPESKPQPRPEALGDRPKRRTLLARATLYADKWPPAHEGERNHAAYHHTCQLRAKFDLPDADAWQILANWNASNAPPLAERELQQAFASAKRHAKNPPGSEMTATCRRQAKALAEPDPMTELRQHHAAIADGRIRCVPLPWAALNHLTRALLPGRVTILAGTKGAAKSFMVLQAILFWLNAGENIAVYIMEGSVTEYLGRALAQLAGNAEFTNPGWIKAHYGETQDAERRHAEALARLGQRVTRSRLGATQEQVAGWVHEQAKAGRRVVVIDPVTMAMRTSKPWIADKHFIDRVKTTAEEHGCSVVCVSHLQKGAAEGATDVLAGSAAWERFSDCIIQLRRHDVRTSKVRTVVGTCDIEHNQTFYIEKARAPGTGLSLAFQFNADSLTLSEIGTIVGKGKKLCT